MDVRKKVLGDVHIMMFYARPKNVNLTHSIKFITIIFLKYSFSVPTGNKNSQVYQISHKFWRDIPRFS